MVKNSPIEDMVIPDVTESAHEIPPVPDREVELEADATHNPAVVIDQFTGKDLKDSVVFGPENAPIRPKRRERTFTIARLGGDGPMIFHSRIELPSKLLESAAV